MLHRNIKRNLDIRSRGLDGHVTVERDKLAECNGMWDVLTDKPILSVCTFCKRTSNSIDSMHRRLATVGQ